MYLFCDIDGTVSVEPTDRRQAAQAGDWDLYYSLDFSSDEPRRTVCSVVQSWLEAGGVVIFVTSRRETVRPQTETWLVEHLEDCRLGANVFLNMRDADDMMPAPLWKVKAVTEMCPKASAALVWDDDHEACAALRDLGYAVMEVL